jgi:hypothetical protein
MKELNDKQAAVQMVFLIDDFLLQWWYLALAEQSAALVAIDFSFMVLLMINF